MYENASENYIYHWPFSAIDMQSIDKKKYKSEATKVADIKN